MKIKFDNGRVVEFEGQPSDEDIDYVARQVFAAPPLDDAPKDEWNRYYKATIKPEEPSLVETEVMSPMRSALSTYATAGLAKEGLGAVNPQLKQSLFPEQRTMPGKIFRGGLELGATVAGLPTKLAISGVKAASKLIPRAVVPVERLAAATLGQKLATGAVGGLIEGATLAPKDLDASEYGKQIALSGGAGAVLPVIGSAIVNKFPRLMSDEGLVRRVSDKVQTGIWKALRPTIIGKKSQSQLKAFDQKASAAVLDIISNKSNNNFIDEVGNIKPNNLPESIDDMAKAIADGRKRVFAEYNALSQGATDKGAIIGVGNTQSVLEKYATDPVLVAENPSLANFALKQHEALTRRGKFTPLEAEEKIAEWNFDLKSKYNSGEFGIQTTQKALKEMVEALRKDLDSSIQQATGSKLYQGLKNKYGAYKALADEVGRRLPVARRASPSGFFDIADAFASGDMLSGGVGLVTGDPSAPARLLRGLGLNVGKTILKRRNDPNRIIGTMFQDVDALLNESNRRATSSQTAVGQKAKQFIKRRGEPVKVKGLTIEDVGDTGSGKVIQRSGQVNSAKKFLAERPEGTVEDFIKSKTVTKKQMIDRGADGHLSKAVEMDIPVSKIDGREPTPSMEGGYKKGTPITQPIEVEYQPDSDTYILYAGNHRVTQAELNGDKTIKAFVENGQSQLTSEFNAAKGNKGEVIISRKGSNPQDFKTVEEYLASKKVEVPIVRDSEGMIDVKRTELRLSSVPEGYVRLYRAEGGKFKHEDIWKEEDFPLPKGFVKGDSEFYTPELKYAGSYQYDYGKGSKINYIDVPPSMVNPTDMPYEVFLNKSQLTSEFNAAKAGKK